MALESKELKVLKLSEIPTGFVEGSWILDCDPGSYHQAHICHLDENDEIDKWIVETYPELKEVDSFLVHIDVDLFKEDE